MALDFRPICIDCNDDVEKQNPYHMLTEFCTHIQQVEEIEQKKSFFC